MKPSTIERLHEGRNEESALAQMMRHQREQAARYAAAEPQRRFEEQARALPDELFADHPEVIRLRAVAVDTQRRAKQVCGSSWPSRLGVLRDSVEVDLRAAEQALQWAALDDVLADDATFPKALAAMATIEHCRQRAAAIQLAARVLGQDRVALIGLIQAEVKQAENALLDQLLDLKRDYLKTQPGDWDWLR